jgi:hypothetical protein
MLIMVWTNTALRGCAKDAGYDCSVKWMLRMMMASTMTMIAAVLNVESVQVTAHAAVSQLTIARRRPTPLISESCGQLCHL